MSKVVIYSLLIAAILNISGCVDDTSVSTQRIVREDYQVFDLLDSSYTGVNFTNNILEDISTNDNVFDFDYFYNGSGVATVDLNNDGLLDLIFTANQSQNKVYKNKGNLRFEDVTKSSGINRGKGWATGITYVDINNDGWQDIYIAQGGPNPGDASRNLLFINQQNFRFIEAAAEYGLADESISSQSAFFDYDKDGDLDCLVMNENLLFGIGPTEFYQLMAQDNKLLHHSSSHLYENNNGKFEDATEKAGLLSPTFGLGLAISDINSDGWLDIYIANDYYVPDAMYINQQDGTFLNSIKDYTNHTSFFGMGVDIADINSDTHQDIFVLDMASTDHYRSKTLMASMNVDAFNLLVGELELHHQYMFNTLQLSESNNHFNDIAHMTNMAKSDWSWSVLMNDLDNNTTTDVYITNGYKKYALDNDIRNRVIEAKKKYNGNVPLHVKKQIYDLMPSEKLPNVLFENKGKLAFDNATTRWGLSQASFSNGAVQADLDNDGDLDIVVNNIDDLAFIYKNNTSDNTNRSFLHVELVGDLDHSFAKVYVFSSGNTWMKESKAVRGYLSSTDTKVHFGLGDFDVIDSVQVEWLSGKKQTKRNVTINSIISFDESDAINISQSQNNRQGNIKIHQATEWGIDFSHKENEFDDFELETLLPYKQSTLGPCIAIADVNSDNLDDIFIGGATGQSSKLYIQNDSNHFVDVTPEVFAKDASYEDLDAVFFDIDLDGDQDLFVVSGGYEYKEQSELYKDRLYINNGFGSYQRAVNTSIDANTYSGKSVSVIDFDKDGLLDIVVGNRVIPGKYPVASKSILYKNTGNDLIDVTEEYAPELLDFGIVNDVLATDFNSDGWQDLIVVGEWSAPGIFQNKEGKFERIKTNDLVDNSSGWWFSVKEIDINKDNLPDYVLGNLGLNSKYKTSKNKPLKIYADDFDDNDTWDIVLSNSYKGQYVPLRGRECSSGQMPFIADSFPTYDLFAKASLEDVYGQRLKGAYSGDAKEFSSIILINRGGGKFDISALPVEAQSSPILDMEILDFNNDGYDDLFILGTIYNTEVETPRLDAGSGKILLNTGEEQFRLSEYANRNIYVEGNLKTVEKININEDNHLIIGRNNGTPIFLKLTDIEK